MTGNNNQLKILLVDDVAFFRDVMRDYFRRTPVSVSFASNGREAVEIATRVWPDLIYMDVAMPEMTGIEACRKLKADPRLAKIPILLIFTPDRDASEDDVKASGCDGYLKKPFGREEFLNLGHRYLYHIERRERRVPCQMTVDFIISGKSFQGRGIDLSLHGLYIEFREEIPPQKLIEVSFVLPTVSPHRINAKGRVAWVNQGFPRMNLSLPQGFGIEFQSIDMESIEVVKKFLEKV
ncbi:MAG: response regulator [Desulfuromonadales bacterium]|nr:response regulator [Desulfuromonadales bacterium]